MRKFKNYMPVLSLLLMLVICVASVQAMPPTKEAIAKWKAEGVWEQKVANWKAFKARGGSSPEEQSVFNKKRLDETLALGDEVADTVNLMVILIDFSDWTAGGGVIVSPEEFETQLFSNRDIDVVHNPTGSMTDYYIENSYGQFYIKGEVYGWYRMPLTYDYYAGDDHGISKTQELAGCALDSARAHIPDFTVHDRNEDGVCDGFIIIHAGPGAEEGGPGIWSHKSNISARTYDGVSVSAYTMNPEEHNGEISPIGVFCHEYGHVLGLPDLYDIDYIPETSNGLGKWTIMASGSWGGGGKLPVHFDAWCKSQIPFIDLINVSNNLVQAEIPHAEENPIAYYLRSPVSNSEYWVVENRQKVGFD
ncbi:MAG: M6 family metalloprotease domain-containing protein, partial [candidate division Zixibacteria bacterium]|nr:M6 family metalloprotease domain-containing protein [candidate division Zixibacteria bacterium]